MNDNYAQMDVRLATDTGGWKHGCCSVFVDSLFHVAPIFRGGSVFGSCFVMQFLVSFLVVHSP